MSLLPVFPNSTPVPKQNTSSRIPGTVIPPPLIRGGQQASSKLASQQNTQIVMPPLVLLYFIFFLFFPPPLILHPCSPKIPTWLWLYLLSWGWWSCFIWLPITISLWGSLKWFYGPGDTRTWICCLLFISLSYALSFLFWPNLRQLRCMHAYMMLFLLEYSIKPREIRQKKLN